MAGVAESLHRALQELLEQARDRGRLVVMHHVTGGSDDAWFQLRDQATHLLRRTGTPQAFEEIRLLARDIQQRRPHFGPAGFDFRTPVQDRVYTLVPRIETRKGPPGGQGNRLNPRVGPEISASLRLSNRAGPAKEAPLKTPTAFFLVAGLCACATPAPGQSAGRNVTVEVQTDDGRVLPLYPARGRGGDTRVYAEAVQGQRYRIVVHNNQDRRVGLVIAVDGRNIISGQQSWLRPDERMYILGPYETQEYTGWRTAADRIHRFYFTEAGDSYASAFGDESAMGLISVAAYAEARPLLPPRPWFFKRQERDGLGSGSAVPEAECAPGPSGRANVAPLQAKPRADQADQRRRTG